MPKKSTFARPKIQFKSTAFRTIVSRRLSDTLLFSFVRSSPYLIRRSTCVNSHRLTQSSIPNYSICTCRTVRCFLWWQGSGNSFSSALHLFASKKKLPHCVSTSICIFLSSTPYQNISSDLFVECLTLQLLTTKRRPGSLRDLVPRSFTIAIGMPPL